MFDTGRRRFVMAAVGLGASLAYARWPRGSNGSPHGLAAREAFVRSSHALGTKVSITVLEANRRPAEAALDAAFGAIEEVEAQLSLYRCDSQLSRLNAAGRLAQPHPDLLAVLGCAAETSRRSQGAFDITVQPLWECYAAAQALGRLPTPDEVAQAQRLVDWRRVQVSRDEVRLMQGTKITLNGIAQGYAADRALAALQQHGIIDALVDTGELAASGASRPDAEPDPIEPDAIEPQAPGWKVGVQHPREPEAFVALAKLKDRCLSTSGDYATCFSRDRRLHHVFDPATGASPGELASVSVVAPTAMQADAWSTALFVLGAKRSTELLSTLPDHDALFVMKDGRTLATPGFPWSHEGVAS